MAQESWKREQEAGCQPPDGPIRCAKNCGFFGSAATSNMCSKCYRDHVVQQTKEAGKVNAAASAKAAAQLAASVNRPELMEVDSKEREASDTDTSDFMSGVHVLAGMAAKDKAAAPSSMQVDLAFPSASSLQASPGEKQAAIAVSSPLASAAAAAAGSPGTGAGEAAVAAGPATHPNRCAACKKKVGLTGFKCRCNGVFCSSHRYSDKHDCTFDYKAAARESIAKANPVVRGSKIEKI